MIIKNKVNFQHNFNTIWQHYVIKFKIFDIASKSNSRIISANKNNSLGLSPT